MSLDDLLALNIFPSDVEAGYWLSCDADFNQSLDDSEIVACYDQICTIMCAIDPDFCGCMTDPTYQLMGIYDGAIPGAAADQGIDYYEFLALLADANVPGAISWTLAAEGEPCEARDNLTGAFPPCYTDFVCEDAPTTAGSAPGQGKVCVLPANGGSDSTTYEYQYNTDWHVTSNGCLQIVYVDGVFTDEYVVEDQVCCDALTAVNTHANTNLNTMQAACDTIKQYSFDTTNGCME